MKATVIVVWRPKHFPDWHGRRQAGGAEVPAELAFDRSAAPYTGVHIASLLPRHWEVSLVHEMVRDVDLEMDVDAVFLSTMDFCAPHALWLARRFRARGVKVIVGGLFPTLKPEYFAGAVDAVVVGEAEPVIARLVADLERGALEPIYRAGYLADLASLPAPRYELIERDFSLPFVYEVTRGCPFTCSFCVLSAIRSPYRRRPIANVLRDLRSPSPAWSFWQRRIVGFWDNNLGADRRYFRDLCSALTPLKKHWGTETSLDTITPESARAMGKAGCRFVYVGLESLAQESLTASNKRHNQVSEMKRRITLLHDNGILVMSIFLVGLDADTSSYLRALPGLIDDVGVDIPVYSFAAPIEGTPFKAELVAAGRLTPGDHCDGMDGAQLLYRPKNVAPDELERALFDCQRASYGVSLTLRRVIRRAPDGVVATLMAMGTNWFYARHQRAIARVGRRRIAERGRWRAPTQ